MKPSTKEQRLYKAASSCMSTSDKIDVASHLMLIASLEKTVAPIIAAMALMEDF